MLVARRRRRSATWDCAPSPVPHETASSCRSLRWSAARGFLKPILSRGNLEVATEAHAERLVVEEGRAVAVRYLRGGASLEARANRDIVLTAGAFWVVSLLAGPREGLRRADAGKRCAPRGASYEGSEQVLKF